LNTERETAASFTQRVLESSNDVSPKHRSDEKKIQKALDESEIDV
jgi:phage gp36-like protein